MRSVILQTTTRLAYPVIMTFALFMFFRGHNFPGGGFIGGLLASAGMLLIYIAFGMREGDRIYGQYYRTVAVIGLVCAAGAAITPMVMGMPFLTSLFWQINIPAVGMFDVSTVLLFDFGVFLVVVGTLVGSVKVLVVEHRFAKNNRGRGSESR